VSYGSSQADAYRRAGIYADRILKGATPANMPVELASKIDFVINLATAKALGLSDALSRSRFRPALFQFSKRAASEAAKFGRGGVELLGVIAAARLECGEPATEAGELIRR
jgi:hypothetical protein